MNNLNRQSRKIFLMEYSYAAVIVLMEISIEKPILIYRKWGVWKARIII